jgi:cell division protein ZipA
LSEEPVLAPAALDAELRSAADESLFTEELDEYPTAELPVLAEAAEYAPASPALEQTASLEAPGQAAPIVEWPPEASRQIVALRLVAPAERFPGRAVRLALAAEGFLLGQFDIFHKPDETHRAVVSVASLTRPGTFDLDTMDSQRYAGLSLFVVLPGPCPGQQAFDELVGVALNLRERLQGELQDARGEMLTDESIELLRDALFPGGAGEAES